jgi:hypothetical protein
VESCEKMNTLPVIELKLVLINDQQAIGFFFPIECVSLVLWFVFVGKVRTHF